MAKVNWQYTDGTVSNIMEVGPYGRGSDVYAITFTYKVDGHYYGGEFNATTGHGYSEGGKIEVGYNPANPEENNLNEKDGWMRWMPLIYVAGLGFYIFYLRSCHK